MSLPPLDKNTRQTPVNNPTKVIHNEELASRIVAQAHHMSSASASSSSTGPSMTPIEQISELSKLNLPIEKFIEMGLKIIVEEFKKCLALDANATKLDVQMDKMYDVDPKSEASKEFKDLKELKEAIDEKVLKTFDNINELQDKFLRYLNGKLKQGENFSKLPVSFAWRLALLEGREDENIEFLQNLSINKLKNTCLYIENVKGILEKNKKLIVEKFCDKSAINLNQIKFSLKLLGEETHHRGQVTMLVTVSHEGTNIGRVVYKPRSAETEIEILKLFALLNDKVSSEQEKLTIYRIESLGPEGSIWEFIDGDKLDMPAIDYLDKIRNSLTLEKFETATANLHRLQTICKKIGVTDLHMENVILVNQNKWVPIDHEVINSGHITGLYGENNEPEPLAMTPAEDTFIKAFNDAQFNRQARTVPVSTAVLTTNSDFEGAKEITKSLNIAFRKEKFTVLPSSSSFSLEKLIDDDIRNGDISLFSEKEGILYYDSDQMYALAIKKEKKNELNK
jgi:hypothetical protein